MNEIGPAPPLTTRPHLNQRLIELLVLCTESPLSAAARPWEPPAEAPVKHLGMEPGQDRFSINSTSLSASLVRKWSETSTVSQPTSCLALFPSGRDHKSTTFSFLTLTPSRPAELASERMKTQDVHSGHARAEVGTFSVATSLACRTNGASTAGFFKGTPARPCTSRRSR